MPSDNYFCAICTDAIVLAPGAIPRREPLGRGGALVLVCDGCAIEPARERGPSALGYNTSETGQGAGWERIVAAGNRALAKMGKPQSSPLTRGRVTIVNDRTPGWILIRVSCRRRDFNEAVATFKHEPWFAEARYLGTIPGYFLFERPNPKIAAELRRPSQNPLIDLEQYRSKP